MATGDLRIDYAGTKGRLLGLAFVTSLITVLTLGVYRFWMKSRLRRFYWSAIRPGGHPLEYVGEPLEKLLGFLIAVVFLAFYIGIVNLILMFLSFSLFQGNFAAYLLSFIGIVPIYFYARYRARRYIFARTRWRGLRFGMDAGAWGYSWRAMIHWLITIATLGLLWPRMTFYLEKYRVDRSFFGVQPFLQGGRWQMLYRPFLPILAGILTLAASTVFAFQGSVLAAVLFGAAGVLLLIYGLVHYNVHSFRKLANTKSLGGSGFIARPRPWRVFGIIGFGHSLVFLCMSFILLMLGGMFGVTLATLQIGSAAEIANNPNIVFSKFPLWVSTIFAIVFYFSVFLSWGVLRQVFVTLPLAKHYAETLEITNSAALNVVVQRERDEFAEAEGFAEALDVGAAI